MKRRKRGAGEYLNPTQAFNVMIIRPRLRALDLEESAKNRKEEARNTLESYLYRLRDLLDEDNRDTPFKQCSQPAERSAIGEKVQNTIAWLHDSGDVAETSQFLDKRAAIESVNSSTVSLSNTHSL